MGGGGGEVKLVTSIAVEGEGEESEDDWARRCCCTKESKGVYVGEARRPVGVGKWLRSPRRACHFVSSLSDTFPSRLPLQKSEPLRSSKERFFALAGT